MTQYLFDDNWVLLADGLGRMSARSMQFNGEWKIIVTQAELCEYLNRLHWSKVS